MMWLGILIITIVLVGFVMLALGLKMAFNKDAEFTAHSCKIEEKTKNDSACALCGIKDLVNCQEMTNL